MRPARNGPASSSSASTTLEWKHPLLSQMLPSSLELSEPRRASPSEADPRARRPSAGCPETSKARGEVHRPPLVIRRGLQGVFPDT